MTMKTNPSIATYEIMKEKGYTPEEVETFLAFLKRRDRSIYLAIYGVGTVLALLILFVPGAAAEIASRLIFG